MEVSGFSIFAIVVLVVIVLLMIIVLTYRSPDKGSRPTESENASFLVTASQHVERSKSREEHLNLRGVGKNLSKTYNPDFNVDTTRPTNNVLVKNAISKQDNVVGIMEVIVNRDGSEIHKYKTKNSKLEIHLPAHSVFYTMNVLGTTDVYGTKIEQAFPQISSFVGHLGQFGNQYMVLRTAANISKRDVLLQGGSWKSEGKFDEFSHVDIRTAYLATVDVKSNPIIVKSLGSNFYFH